MKWIRLVFARYLISKNVQFNERGAIRWNHLQGIILTRGHIKFDYDLLRGIKRNKCKRCLTVVLVGNTHCTKCKEWIDEQKSINKPVRKNSSRKRKRVQKHS